MVEPGPQNARAGAGDVEQRSRVAVVAAVAALLIGALLLGMVVFGGDSYTIKARFQNAGQLVKGNYVQVGGSRAGTVKSFEITEDGQVDVEIEIDERFAPLREGTKATVRQGSLTSTANRYVDLFMPSEENAGDEIPDGGRLGTNDTTSTVDIDQFFNVFDRPTRRALRGFFKGGQRQYAGRGEEANAGLEYLPANLAASTRLFTELRYDDPALERFVVNSSRFVTALADRRDDLAPLIENLNRTTRALGTEKAALAEAIELFPDFMRTANTTYVNLRGTLDELDPFVEASKPVARKLRPFLAELRPFAREAVPTVRDFSAAVRRPGRDNDLVELGRTYPPLEDIALVTRQRSIDFGTGAVDVGERRGAFPELTEALTASTPVVAHGRPYTPDLFGWFDDFSHTGGNDAVASFSRSQVYINAFSANPGTTPTPIPLPNRGQAFRALARTYQLRRCPGASEQPADDGSNVFSEEEQHELDCRESDRATGPIAR